MERELVWIIAGLGAITLFGVFYRMASGMMGGPFNLRAVGMVFVGTLVAILAVKEPSTVPAATGVFGAIIGYLFGIKDR